MKVFILLISMFATLAHAEESQRDSTRNVSGVRNEYDDLLKSSGKWEFLGTSSIVLGLLSGGVSLYAYHRQEYYLDLQKRKILDQHEEHEKNMWKDVTDATGYGGAALVGFGLFGYYMEMHYENRAHQFGLDMSVKF